MQREIRSRIESRVTINLTADLRGARCPAFAPSRAGGGGLRQRRQRVYRLADVAVHDETRRWRSIEISLTLDNGLGSGKFRSANPHQKKGHLVARVEGYLEDG